MGVHACPKTYRRTIVGIDLGTCYSRVAVWQDGDVAIIPDDTGRLSTPSVVAYTNHGVLVGEAAESLAPENISSTIFAPQRLVGTKFSNPWVHWYTKQWPMQMESGEDDRLLVRVTVNGKDMLLAPEDILSHLLSYLRRLAESFLRRPVVEAVVTVPSRYGGCQREALMAACLRAELAVPSLLISPTACAIAYTFMNRTPQRQFILICNAGGAFFDFALLKVEELHVTELSVGTELLDLDGCLSAYCKKELLDKYGVDLSTDSLTLWKLREACEQTKRKLSFCNVATVHLRKVTDEFDYICTMSRPHYEDLCKYEMAPIMEGLTGCLEDSRIDKAMVDEVIIVGGSSRIPLLRSIMIDFFHGKFPREVLQPEQAGVLGAAAFAAALVASGRGEDTPSDGSPSPRGKVCDATQDDEGEAESCCTASPIQSARMPRELQDLQVTQVVSGVPASVSDSSITSEDEEDMEFGEETQSTNVARDDQRNASFQETAHAARLVSQTFGGEPTRGRCQGEHAVPGDSFIKWPNRTKQAFRN
eukprot:TRINITY_DN55364_c0_g1_i1.p1 TRINITY_DN55364_c0_g1~~TRINITY_DN55364_c0_g1_i1.p1  ORF type:complete len:533 (+),score=85.05 TRINITY_DN55364_c0_g1_i1:137-1735(+)